MAVTTTQTNKPFNPRGNDQSPKGYNRAALYSGKALDFDGVNDYVRTPNISTQSTNVWTYSSNIAFSSATAYWFDARESDIGYSVYFNSSIKKLILYTTSGITFDFEFEIDKWYNIALTSNSTTASLYVNGQLVDSNNYTNSFSVTGDFYIGARHSLSSYLNGQMAGFKAFDIALTAAQVADLYNNPEKVVPTGVDNTALKLWLPMQEGAGTTAINGAPDALGSEEVTNGDFATDSDWTKGTGWSISGGLASSDGSQSATSILSQNITGIQNKDVLIKIVVTSVDAGSLDIGLGGTGGIDILNINSPGTYSVIAKSTTATASLTLQAAATFVGSVDSISIKELANCGIISGATWTHGIGAPVAQTSVIDWNKGDYLNDAGTITEILVPQGLTSGRDLLGNLFENVRKQGALNLDGNSWAEVHDNASLDITDAVSVECWYYHVDQNTTKGIFGKWIASSSDRSYTLYMDAANKIAFTTSDDGGGTLGQAIATTSFTDDNWYHILGTFDGSSVKIYVNGTLERTTAASGSIYNSDAAVAIGHINGNLIYDQPIAQPRIYNRALTAEEVQRNYNAGKNTYTN
ncbi:LamG domain-containing protein [bacterium]|nr:LamG domain-containing protein [bacterium]